MNTIPRPVSAGSATSRAQSRTKASQPMLPRGAPAFAFAGANSTDRDRRGVHHPRRNSGSRAPIFDARVNKSAHRTKVGLWLDSLESVDSCALPPSPVPSPQPFRSAARRRSSSSMTWSDKSQLAWKPGSPRTPLADITPLVLAAESPSSSFELAGEEAEGFFAPPPQDRTPRLVPNLAGAIDLLTADEARHLLLLSAQSNVSLAAAINDLALGRIPTPPQPAVPVQQSYLADTFRFD